MLTMAPKTAWQKRLVKLQRRLALTNTQIAKKLRISVRLWKAWKYAESVPTTAGEALISLLEENKISE